VRLLAWRSSSEVWARLHEQAFRRLGGAPCTVVLDNLKGSSGIRVGSGIGWKSEIEGLVFSL